MRHSILPYTPELVSIASTDLLQSLGFLLRPRPESDEFILETNHPPQTDLPFSPDENNLYFATFFRSFAASSIVLWLTVRCDPNTRRIDLNHPIAITAELRQNIESTNPQHTARIRTLNDWLRFRDNKLAELIEEAEQTKNDSEELAVYE